MLGQSKGHFSKEEILPLAETVTAVMVALAARKMIKLC
jgi:hypothetical protein